MMQSNLEQLWHVFACLGCGVWFGLGYDVLRVYRLWHRCSKGVIFLQDFLYILTATMCLFLFTLAVNGGELRPDIVAAVILGFLVFRHAGSPLVFTAARLIKHLFEPILRGAAQIGAQIGRFTANFIKKIAIFFKKGLHRISILLYNECRK